MVRAYCFGKYVLDARRRLLRTADKDEIIPLTPKGFDVLLHLVERPGELVSKQELLDAVWPGLIVEENNLTQAVSAARRALGETPHDHRYIATEPGRGYRFVARVVSQDEDEARPTATGGSGSDGQTQRSLSGERKPRARKARWAIAGAVVAVLAIALVAYLPESAERPLATSLKITNTQPVLNAPGNHTRPSFSPGGSSVVFVSDASGLPQLYVKNLASGRPRQLTDGPPGVASPSWSPRDDRIIYASLSGGIWSIDPMGTMEPRLLIEEGSNPSYSFDGRTFVFERDSRIFVANADGSGLRGVEGPPSPEPPFIEAFPQLSPDGQDIVFFLPSVGPLGDYWLIPAAGGKARKLTSDLHWGGRAAWMPDGQHIIFPSKRGGTMTLWSIRTEGGAPEPLTSGLGQHEHPDVSHDGTRLLYAHTRFEAAFVVTDLKTGNEREIYRHQKMVAFPRISPDGSLIAFFGEVAPREQILVMNADGSNVRQLTEFRENEANIMPRWSPDGEAVFYYQNFPPESVRRISLSGGASEAVLPEFGWHSHMDVEWSPDGTRIAYVRIDRNTTARRVVVRELANGSETTLPPEVQFAPQWSADGTRLLATGWQGVFVCQPDGSSCRHIADIEGPAQAHFARWSRDESQIFYTQGSENPIMLGMWTVDTDGSNPRHLFELGPVHPIAARFQVLPGDRILWPRYRSDQTELVLARLNRTSN